MSERRLLLASGAYIDLSEYLLKSEAETLYAPLDAILNKQDKLISGTNIKTINNENILGSGNITISLTESDIAGMGFTKNTGTYSKPSTGIPKSDLASAVQTSLGKADTALQSYTEQYKGTVTGVKINGTTKNPTSGVVDLGTVITAHQDIRGKQDKLVSGTNIKTINGTSILGSGDIEMPYYEDVGCTYVKKGISDDNLMYALPSSAGGREDDILVTKNTLKTINGESIVGSGNITISGGGSSDANVMAVDTGDVIDDVTVDYATTAYVDGLIGDINSVLESIINS